jgi:HTH-type transcriptional regulator / antitoxin HigA
MRAAETFSPDWTSPPGETISDVLRERDISIDDFAEKMQKSHQEILELLQGHSPITLGIARQLEKTLGASVEFWMSREFRYRERLGGSKEEANLWVQSLTTRSIRCHRSVIFGSVTELLSFLQYPAASIRNLRRNI